MNDIIFKNCEQKIGKVIDAKGSTQSGTQMDDSTTGTRNINDMNGSNNKSETIC